MATPNEEGVWVANHPGNRPYIAGQREKHLIFNDDFKPSPGEIWLSEEETNAVKESGYIVVEPEVKNTLVHTVNKSWPREYWLEVAKMELPFIQMGNPKTPIFPLERTSNFRQALAILSKAKLFVGTDGALHHAAAALGIPAVVIWTGFSSPKHLGYDSHINLHDGSKPCGYYGGVCQHCRDKAKAIKPNRVIEEIYNALI